MAADGNDGKERQTGEGKGRKQTPVMVTLWCVSLEHIVLPSFITFREPATAFINGGRDAHLAKKGRE